MFQLRKKYGDEYPTAVMMNGIRLPLRRERRFSRSYRSDEHKMGTEISRLEDGSASITALEVRQEWSGWTDDIRMDFCQSSSCLHNQPDYPEMLRFILQHGEPKHCSAIALSAASHLPRDEAFDTLVRALRSMEFVRTSNILQAIAHTKHADAEVVLRNHLEALWSHRSLWEEDEFMNWVGFDATTCIAELIELGAVPSDFVEHVRRLSEHVCSRNRDSCRHFLSKHFSWLQ